MCKSKNYLCQDKLKFKMNCYLLFSIFLVGNLVASAQLVYTDDELILFKQMYGKQYANCKEEFKERDMFPKNNLIMERFKAKQVGEEASHQFGLRLSENEMKLAQNKPEVQKVLDKILKSSDDVPDEVDWRKVAGRVSSVKDQGNCLSAWAFAGIGLLEGQEKIRRGNDSDFIELSTQNVLDCAIYGEGCLGGFPEQAFVGVIEGEGIEAEKSYPYVGRIQNCYYEKSKSVMNIKGYDHLPIGDEKALKRMVAQYGPVAAVIHATRVFDGYKGGVFKDSTCCNGISATNHSVLVVGYGADVKEGDYWILKNSWGEKWGEEGYIRLARNNHNHCGIASTPSFATF